MKIATENKSVIDQKATLIAIENSKINLLRETASGQVLVIGVEDKSKITQRQLFKLIRNIISAAKNYRLKEIALPIEALNFPHLKLAKEKLLEHVVVQAELANFQFNDFKTPPKDGFPEVEKLTLIGDFNATDKKIITDSQTIAKEINDCRRLANTPGGIMTPKKLADAAKKAVAGTKATYKTLDKKEMVKLGMGGILGVAQGSTEDPFLIVLEYFGGAKSEAPTVYVGKGVTFDTGGLNIKTDDGMLEMHLDMSGGAAVIHAVALAAKLKLKKNVIGLIPAVENMPSGSSYRPGDILKTMSGKTIEVLNTDAEGRIILADALTYAEKYKPSLVVDVATLTGAALIALGQRASAIFTKDEDIAKRLIDAGEASGNYVWPLPLWDEYEEEVKGTFGDVANIGKSGRAGGAIAGAMFLYQFAKDYPWVHIDMAPRMTSIEGDHLAKGAAGEPVALLLELLRSN